MKFLTKRPSPFTSKELPVPLRRSSGSVGPVLPGTIRDRINAEFGGSLFPHDFGVGILAKRHELRVDNVSSCIPIAGLLGLHN